MPEGKDVLRGQAGFDHEMYLIHPFKGQSNQNDRGIFQISIGGWHRDSRESWRAMIGQDELSSGLNVAMPATTRPPTSTPSMNLEATTFPTKLYVSYMFE